MRVEGHAILVHAVWVHGYLCFGASAGRVQRASAAGAYPFSVTIWSGWVPFNCFDDDSACDLIICVLTWFSISPCTLEHAVIDRACLACFWSWTHCDRSSFPRVFLIMNTTWSIELASGVFGHEHTVIDRACLRCFWSWTHCGRSSLPRVFLITNTLWSIELASDVFDQWLRK